MEKGEKPMAEEKVPQVEENEEKTREQIAEEMRKAEQNRRSEIQEEHEKFIDKPFAQRIYNEMIADMDKGVRDYKDAVLDAMKEESERVPTVKPAKQTQSQIVTSIPTSLRYNKSSLHGFERFGAKAEEAAYRSGQWARAILFNDQRAARWCQDQGIRVMNELSGGSGGFTVPDELEMAITDLRNEYGVARQLCKVVPMGTLNTSIPIRSAGVTATFTPEQGSMTASDMTWKSANLVAKKLTAETRITKELAEDAIIDIAAIVADEHAWAFAQKEDECFINGDGTSTYGGITGLKTKFNADATLAGHVAHPGSANDADTFAEVQQDGIAKAMGALPSYARSGAVFLSSPTADSMIFEYIMATAGGNSTMTLGGAVVPSYLGKRRVVSESMPSDSTADYSASTILMYGDFSKACFFGDRSGIEMQVLRELYATSGQIAVIGTERFDINVDYAIGDATTAGSVVALVGN